jgi:ribulose 1,5-bisphosphate synthetase/thiazole synthase
MDFNIPMKLTQLVCASNMENAKQAVKNQLEKSGKFIMTMCRIDYLIVGAGLFGAVCAYELTKLGKRCLVVDKNNFIGGNCHTNTINDINISSFGE